MKMSSKKCRLCLSSFSNITNIFTLTNGIPNSELIKMFYEIEVDINNDKLPQNICHKCVQDLEYIYTNRLKYQMNQKILEEELETEKCSSLPNGMLKNSTKMLSIRATDTLESPKYKEKSKYVRVHEDDLIQLCNVSVQIARCDAKQNVIKGSEKGIKYTRRKISRKLFVRNKRIVDYYYRKDTKALKTLITKRLNEISVHSKNLHEDIYDFRISVENRQKLCSIEKWNNISADLLEIKMEQNIFMCTFCCRMFNTKWMLRIHEQKHRNVTIKEYEPNSRSSSPLTII